MARTIPVSLVIADDSQKQALTQIITELKSTVLHSGNANDPSVLIYQPGENTSEMLPQIAAAITSGELIAVILAANNPDPELLINAMRAGITEYISFPAKREDVATAISRAAGKKRETTQTQSGKTITVLGSRGGLGATTLAVNLACALQRNDSPVALLDLVQPQGDVPLFLDLDYSYTWHDLIENITRMDETYLRSSLSTYENGLSVIPAPYNGGRPHGQALSQILTQLNNIFATTIIDTTFIPTDIHVPEIENADILLLPTLLTLPGLAWTRRQLETLRQNFPEHRDNLHLIACRHTLETGIEPSDAEEILEKPIRWTIPEHPVHVATALNQGTPLISAFPKSPAAKAILSIAAYFGAEEEKKNGLSLKNMFGFLKKNAPSGSEQNPAGGAV
ncbi:MAG: AAA family ATPase [Desulfovibrio sp.]